MSFKTNPNANTNHFLSGGANKPNRQLFASASTAAAPNSFSTLKSFIYSPDEPTSSSSSLVILHPQIDSVTTPYDKNVDFPTLAPTKAAASASASAFSYRTAVMTSTALQQAQQARIQKEMEQELNAKEKVHDQLRRDAARSRDVDTALAAAASYDISDISESVVGRHTIE